MGEEANRARAAMGAPLIPRLINQYTNIQQGHKILKATWRRFLRGIEGPIKSRCLSHLIRKDIRAQVTHLCRTLLAPLGNQVLGLFLAVVNRTFSNSTSQCLSLSQVAALPSTRTPLKSLRIKADHLSNIMEPIMGQGRAQTSAMVHNRTMSAAMSSSSPMFTYVALKTWTPSISRRWMPI